VPSGATSGGVGGSVSSASLLKLQQQQQQQTVPLQQQQQSSNAPQPPFNQVNKFNVNNALNVTDETKFREYIAHVFSQHCFCQIMFVDIYTIWSDF